MRLGQALVMRLAVAVLLVLILALGVVAQAQEEGPEHWYTFNFGGGWTPLAGQIGDLLSDRGHATAGFGFRIRSHFAATAQVTYHSFGVKPFVTPGEVSGSIGRAHVFSSTLDPSVHLKSAGSLDPYLIGGVGYYRRTVGFSGTPPITPDPLAEVSLPDPGLLRPRAAIPVPGPVAPPKANTITEKSSHSGIGGSAGAGLGIRLGATTASFFGEARYVYAHTGSFPTRMIPVTLGFRW